MWVYNSVGSVEAAFLTSSKVAKFQRGVGVGPLCPYEAFTKLVLL